MTPTDPLTSEPSISVVMAARNAERTIADAIVSVLLQTYTDFELVICDDASVDDTVLVVSRFSDPRIKLLRNASNLGPGLARDRAIEAARGKWLTQLDADDQFAPRRLAELVSVAEQFPDDVIASDVLNCHDTELGLVPWGPALGRRMPDGEGSARKVGVLDFLRVYPLIAKPFVRRERAAQIGARHGARATGEDLIYLFHFLAHGSLIRYVRHPSYLYRLTPGSLSSSHPQRYRNDREVLEEVRGAFSGDDLLLRAFDRKIAILRDVETYQVFFRALVSRRWKNAWTAFRVSPWVAGEFVKRTIGALPFYLHRRWYGGRRRTQA